MGTGSQANYTHRFHQTDTADTEVNPKLDLFLIARHWWIFVLQSIHP